MKLVNWSTLCLFIFVVFSSCKSESTGFHNEFTTSSTEEDSVIYSNNLIPVEAFTMDYFPCNDCHLDQIPNSQRRELVEMHDDILFDHDSENRWCLACHSLDNRDSLRLASGTLIGFDESYKLCGQCHGPKYRDWKLGIHGKRTGDWNGEKQYLLCVHCHDPHTPKIKQIKPLPPPRRPEQLNLDSTYESQE